MSNVPLPPIVVCCPACQHKTPVAVALAGRVVPCPKCERRIQVPQVENRPAQPPEPSDSNIGNVVSPFFRPTN